MGLGVIDYTKLILAIASAFTGLLAFVLQCTDYVFAGARLKIRHDSFRRLPYNGRPGEIRWYVSVHNAGRTPVTITSAGLEAFTWGRRLSDAGVRLTVDFRQDAYAQGPSFPFRLAAGDSVDWDFPLDFLKGIDQISVSLDLTGMGVSSFSSEATYRPYAALATGDLILSRYPIPIQAWRKADADFQASLPRKFRQKRRPVAIRRRDVSFGWSEGIPPERERYR